ncbi:2Fe-2S iron-sulfur cluster binding domain-containing protein [Niveispirillum sp. SYP-B3756]|uniref:2Fe-2S iron-sulfur cluster-binding protein n=1 Tax=Niveispirillum sp. SYP-B3756 TaxID=2662178 RepID=UPI001292173E|nr:2Fe-2S iron-sulfur cluster-binding protein [Niveispirillum sp. SYP-B3756]MQP68255.1 2Fe-2S iron-sulfur cluster binding domain-containing protein [Niveispirillum sp. SYP-B3756]
METPTPPMPTLTILPDTGPPQTLPLSPGQNLLNAITPAGRDIITALCGGCCICGTCRVRVVDGDPGPMGEREAQLRRQLAITDPAIRLACQTHPPGALSVAILKPR